MPVSRPSLAAPVVAGVLAAVLFFAGLAPAAPAFLAGFEDVPLMPGLTEDKVAGLLFDKPGGRIVEARASGLVSARAVREFYTETMPQLGWTGIGELRFRREGEMLRLELTGDGRRLRVRFYLSPD